MGSSKKFPIDELKQAAELGFAGVYTSEIYGGSGLGRFEAALIFEALSMGCVSTSAFLSIHNMVSWMIDEFGSEEQKKIWLQPLSKFDLIASYCLTEPNSGSDAASLKTRAQKIGGDYLLNGSKSFISGGGVSDLYLVMARTGEAGVKGISAFLVEKECQGVSFGAQEEKLGWNSQPTAQLMLDDCRIPERNRIGNEGDGFSVAMQGLNGGRVNIAACSLGGAAKALEESLKYTRSRKQFGKYICDFQANAFKLADMATELEAARLLVYKAAMALDQKNPDLVQFCAMAKRFATDVCFQITDQALQLFGGYGYLKDYPIERILRDLRVHRILEGTNEIMRLIISRRLNQ